VRILVIEDDPITAELLQRSLTREGHAVDLCATTAEGVWLAGEVPFDAIVLDGVLPDGDGFDVCRALRTAGLATPILMLTSRAEVTDRVTGLDAGADDYLTKPFAPEEVLARLRALRRRTVPPRPTVLRVGDLEVDPATRRVVRQDVPIELTAKEFELLLLLVQADGGVVRRDAIVDALWDFATETERNTIDVHVRNLRTKLDRPFDHKLVETVRGVGYRLAVPEA
jgi:two-component system OmpR family response regulator